MSPLTPETIQSLFSGLLGSVNAIRVYPEGHPQIRSFSDRLWEGLQAALAQNPELALLAVEGTFTLNGAPCPDPGPPGLQTAALLKRKGIDRIVFRSGLTQEELTGFLRELAAGDTGVSSTAHIRLGRIVFTEAQEPSPGLVQAIQARDRAAADFRSMLEGSGTSALDGAVARGFAVDFIRTFQRSANPMRYLASIKSEDEYTYVHTINVALLTMGLASHLGFSGQTLVDITFAALMHDVGKLLIPDRILNKTGPLDAAERAVMETHPVVGAQHLSRQKNMPRLAMLVALEHHVRFGGGGYPDLGADWRPHPVTQMVSVADIYDALRSKRPYRDPMPQEQIAEILRGECGNALNPDLVERFIEMLEKQEMTAVPG